MTDPQQPAKRWSGRLSSSLDRTFGHWHRTLPRGWHCLALALLFYALPAACQDALVTFYAPTIRPTSVLPFSSSFPFYGNVFDGPDRLFSFVSHERFQPGRFVTLRLPAGPHAFSATTKQHANTKEVLELNLEAGKRYFLRARSESHGGDRDLGTFRDRLTSVECQEAIAEAKAYHPLIPRDPPVSLTALRVEEDAFPATCDYFASPAPTTQSPPPA